MNINEKMCLHNIKEDDSRMGEKKNKYSKEFKLDAIRMYLSGEHGGYTPVARTLDITRTNLSNWVSRYSRLGKTGLEAIAPKISIKFYS